MKRNVLTLVVGALLLVIFFLLLFVFQVRKSEVAVVTRFGAPVRDQTQPGAYFKWPWPIEKVSKFDQRCQSFEDDKLDEMQTKDNYIILTLVYVGWRIQDPKVFFPTFPGGSIAEAEKRMKSLVRTAKGTVIGRHPLGDLVNTDASQLKFDEMEQEIKDIVQQQVVTNHYGIRIEFLGLKKLQLPESVTKDVFERMKSEREVLASKSQAEGDRDAQNLRSEANRKASDLLAEAEARAKEIRTKGEVEATKSLAVFQQNPGLANFLFRLEAVEAALKDRSTLLFDQHVPPFDLFRGTLAVTNGLPR